MTIDTIREITGLHARYTRLGMVKKLTKAQNEELCALRLRLIAMELEIA